MTMGPLIALSNKTRRNAIMLFGCIVGYDIVAAPD